MSEMLRASVSLDGKLLTAAGKPCRRGIPEIRLRNATELLLTIHPMIVGNDSIPSLSGLPGSFLSKDLDWELVSVTKNSEGTVVARYRKP